MALLKIRKFPDPVLKRAAAPVSNIDGKLAGLIEILGEAETRELAALFLQSFPSLMKELASGDRERGLRAAHGLKSSSQQIGALELAARMAALEARLSAPGGDATPADIDAAAAAFKESEGALRAFADGAPGTAAADGG